MIKDIEDKMPSITNLATTAALTVVKNQISNVKTLVRKPDYDVKISEIEKKYRITFDYNEFTNDILHAKIKNKKSVNESHISKFINKTGLDKNIKALTTKVALKTEKDKIEKLQTYDSSLFISKS